MKILFKRKRKIPQRNLDEIKNICNIVFVDDKSFPIIDILKNCGWRNLQKLKDIDSIDQKEIREAHIVFMDIQGVGKKLKLPDEGLGLIVAIKKKYPNKRIIAYSAEDQGHVETFHEGLELADSRLSKNANSYEFQFRLEKFSKQIFSLEECVDRIKNLLIAELGYSPQMEEIISKLEKMNKNDTISIDIVTKHFNIQNAANLAAIIQLFLKGN